MRKRSYPTERQIRTALVQRVSEFIKISGMNKSEFGRAAVGDPAFVGRLPASNFTVGTYAKVMSYIAKYRPRATKARQS